MAQQTSDHTVQCPTMETWCAYVDGSLEGPDRSRLSTHLQKCDRCFSAVVSIRQSLEETGESADAVRTPPELLARAGGRTTGFRLGAWVPYAAAAVLLVGFGVWLLGDHALLGPAPWSGAIYARLSALDRQVRERGASWQAPGLARPESLPGESGAFGFAEAASPQKAAYLAGWLLMDLQAAIEFENDIPAARARFNALGRALEDLVPDDELTFRIETLEEYLTDARPDVAILSESLQEFRREVEVLVSAHPENVSAWFDLGVWLHWIDTAARLSKALPAPLPDLIDPDQAAQEARSLAARLRAPPAHEGLSEALNSLAEELENITLTPQQADEILNVIAGIKTFLDSL